MLLSDKELWELVPNADNLDEARALQAAILAKLAAKELPEPEYMPLLLIGAKHSSENVGERSFTEAGFYSAACEIFNAAHAQGFAAGAAAQLAEMPSAWQWTVNKRIKYVHPYCPTSGDYDEGTLIELYTRREAK